MCVLVVYFYAPRDDCHRFWPSSQSPWLPFGKPRTRGFAMIPPPSLSATMTIRVRMMNTPAIPHNYCPLLLLYPGCRSPSCPSEPCMCPLGHCTMSPDPEVSLRCVRQCAALLRLLRVRVHLLKCAGLGLPRLFQPRPPPLVPWC